MTVNTPSAAPEASSEVVQAAPTEQAPAPVTAPDAAAQEALKQTEAVLGARVELAAAAAPKPKVDEVASAAPVATPETVATAAAVAAAEGGGWGALSSVSAFFKKISDTFGDFGKKFGEWLDTWWPGKDKKDDQTSISETTPEVTAEASADEPEVSTEMPGEDLLTPEDATGLLTVKSWDEVGAIADLPTRILQAALYANATNMDCFTKSNEGVLQNHCSGWCDSVFNKAGLNLYDESPRIFCDYENWPKKGTLKGLELQAGDSIIRHNGNASTGNHQEIIISSEGPDADGDYQILTVGQTEAKGKTGTRKVRSMVIHSKDILVVIRPGATEPFEDEGPLVG